MPNLSAAEIRRLQEIRLKWNTYYTGREKLSRMDRALLQSEYVGCTARRNFVSLGSYLGDTRILRLTAKGKRAVHSL